MQAAVANTCKSMAMTCLEAIGRRKLTTQAPHTSAMVIHIPHISLFFPYSLTQHLALIRLPDIHTSAATSSALPGHHPCNLTYDDGKQVLSSKTHTLTRGVVGRVLGPTYAAQGANLDYPGISFTLATSGAASGSGRDDVVQSLDVKPKEEDGSGSRLWKGIRSCRVLVSPLVCTPVWR